MRRDCNLGSIYICLANEFVPFFLYLYAALKVTEVMSLGGGLRSGRYLVTHWALCEFITVLKIS